MGLQPTFLGSIGPVFSLIPPFFLLISVVLFLSPVVSFLTFLAFYRLVGEIQL